MNRHLQNYITVICVLLVVGLVLFMVAKVQYTKSLYTEKCVAAGYEGVQLYNGEPECYRTEHTPVNDVKFELTIPLVGYSAVP